MLGPTPAMMVTSDMVNSFPDHIRKQVVDILKTGEVKKEWLHNDNIACYLNVSHMSTPLKEACEEKLLDGIMMENCIDALEIAAAYGLLRLKKTAITMIGEHFEKVWQSDVFRRINETILEIICSVEIIARQPSIFKALELWLESNYTERLPTYCKILEIVQHHRTQQKQSTGKKCYNTYHAMLMSAQKHAVATAVFNCDGELVCHRKLFKNANIKESFSVTCVQKDETDAPYVFISTGKNVFKYDPMLNKEESCSNHRHYRTESSIASVGDSVFVFGGINSNQSVSEIEELNTKQNTKFMKKQEWKVVSKLPDNIKLCSAPCLPYNNKIYIIGELLEGSDMSTAVLIFNPDDKSVKKIAEFPNKCSDCRAVLHETNIYIASSEGYFLKFDIESNIFTSCSDLPMKSRHFGMYVEGDVIYTVGGYLCENDTGRFDKDEYDIETNCWRKSRNLPCNLPIYGNVDIKVPSYTAVVPFYDRNLKQLI